ncbi:mandelate racemase/muconate lactonizing enzyme family protein [Paracoccus thiocyanatus]|uniref:Mandelate racemase/muconate lactonizing enzyme family protein n=1 Tax=Paracoccus thiocyanatus TaxID=34006 RepID=A0A3D8PGJ1_9RHOB|nr:mandelate racemase/muconate lactonizing enzyme family protein [Paracoccus thiocyanatus]RDW14762.1 mandelate racemase/muconate lactonizing enzyme family protein [Paracoccus thiocyanatus]
MKDQRENSGAKIANITASLHRHDISLPDIADSVETRMFVFCEIELQDGRKGFGVTGQFLPWPIISCIQDHILPAIRGMDPFHTEAIADRVWSRLNNRAYTGVISHALSAVDIALWDLKGKETGRTVAELLGGYANTRPTYSTFGYPFFDEDQIHHYAKKFIADGHKMLKMVVGSEPKRTWRDDVRRVRAARDAAGPDIPIMIDANCWFNPHDALQLALAIEDYGVQWFEEPVKQNDPRTLADLRRQVRVPISSGQNNGHRFSHRDLITHQAVDIIQPNVLYCGGFTEAQKVAHMAQGFNLTMTNGGGWPIFNAHLLCGLSNGGPVEFHHGMYETGKRFFKGTPHPKDGWMTLSDKPGLGYEPDYDQLRDGRVKSAEDMLLSGPRDAHGYLIR